MLLSHSSDADIAAAHDIERSSRVASPIQYDVITTRAEFDALEPAWNDLFERSGRDTQVFQTFNWNWHWANHFLDDDCSIELCVVTGRRDGRLVTLWPLVKEKFHGVTQIHWMGEPVSQYGDVLLDAAEPDADDILRAAWDFLASQCKADVIVMRRVRADSVIAPLLAEKRAIVTDRQIAPYLDLASAPSFEKYEERFSARSRRNRKRLGRRMSEKGDAKFTRFFGGPEARRLTVAAMEMKQIWLKDRGLVSAAFSDDRTARFFADAADGGDKSTGCIVSALTLDGQPTALEVSFACKGRVAMHVIVFNLDYEQAGAGVLRLEQSLRDCCADGQKTYDLLAPGDSYKLDWADGSVAVLDWAKPQTIAGRAYAGIYMGLVRPQAKRALKAMPPALRRIVAGSFATAVAFAASDAIITS